MNYANQDPVYEVKNGPVSITKKQDVIATKTLYIFNQDISSQNLCDKINVYECNVCMI